MKKRLLSLAVALALCLGLAVPAFASDDDKLAWHISTISATQTTGGRTLAWNAVSIDHPWTEGGTIEHTGYRAVAKDSVFTVANVGPAEDDGYIEIWASYCTPKEKENDLYFTYEYAGCLTHKIGFSRDIYNIPTEESGGVVRLLSGQSIQFKLPLEFGEDSIYLLELEKHVPGQPKYYRTSYYFKVDDAAMSSYFAGETPSRPGTPAVQPAEADSFPYSIPGTSEFLRFSTNPVAKYQTIVPDFDANDNLYDKEVTVYQFEVGTKLGLTTQGIAGGYTISNLSSEDFEGSMDQVGFILDKAMMFEQLYVVRSMDHLSFFIYIQPVNTNTSFVDVKPGDYFEEAVKWAVRYGIINGTSTTTFSPGQTCTIAEILTFLYRAVGEPGSSISNPYTNVKPSDYYYEAALWAAEMGMIDSFTFPAATPCSRANAVTFIWQSMGSPPPAAAAHFADVDENADYAQAVSWAVGAGVTNGTSSTTFSPNDSTRGQIVTFLYRAAQ